MLLATSRRFAGATALAALALTLTACGDSYSSGSSGQDGSASLTPAQLLLASYEGLQGQSYTMETTMTVNGLSFLDSTSVVEGDAMRTTQDIHLGAMLEATGQEMLADPALADMMEAMFGDMRTESIIIDGVFYTQLSGGMYAGIAEQYGPDAWFSADLAGQGDFNDVLNDIGGFDLASQTDVLLNNLADVRETSPGVFTGTLSGAAEPMKSIVDSMGTGGDATLIEAVEVVITVDDRGLLRSMEMTLPEIEGVSMEVVSTIIEIGGQYDIVAPQSDNIHPLDELMGAMGGITG